MGARCTCCLPFLDKSSQARALGPRSAQARLRSVGRFLLISSSHISQLPAPEFCKDMVYVPARSKHGMSPFDQFHTTAEHTDVQSLRCFALLKPPPAPRDFDSSARAAWAAKLGSSAELQQALRHPPPYGARNGHRNAQVSPLGETKRGNPSSATGSVAEPGSALEDLKELVAQGIPAKLREMPTAAMVGSRVSGNGGLDDSGGGGGSGRMGGAFMMGKAGEGEEGEAGFLNGVVTSIPRVEVGATAKRARNVFELCEQHSVQIVWVSCARSPSRSGTPPHTK